MTKINNLEKKIGEVERGVYYSVSENEIGKIYTIHSSDFSKKLGEIISPQDGKVGIDYHVETGTRVYILKEKDRTGFYHCRGNLGLPDTFTVVERSGVEWDWSTVNGTSPVAPIAPIAPVAPIAPIAPVAPIAPKATSSSRTFKFSSQDDLLEGKFDSDNLIEAESKEDVEWEKKKKEFETSQKELEGKQKLLCEQQKKLNNNNNDGLIAGSIVLGAGAVVASVFGIKKARNYKK